MILPIALAYAFLNIPLLFPREFASARDWPFEAAISLALIALLRRDGEEAL